MWKKLIIGDDEFYFKGVCKEDNGVSIIEDALRLTARVPVESVIKAKNNVKSIVELWALIPTVEFPSNMGVIMDVTDKVVKARRGQVFGVEDIQFNKYLDDIYKKLKENS